MEFFYEKYTGTPLLDRMGAVMDYFIDEVETLRGRSLNDEEQEIICRKFMNMYVTRDICQIYNWFLEDYGFPALPDMPPERRVLEYEDVYPILYLKYSLTAPTSARTSAISSLMRCRITPIYSTYFSRKCFHAT